MSNIQVYLTLKIIGQFKFEVKSIPKDWETGHDERIVPLEDG